MTDKITVALLCGGRSSEHSISLITAVGVLGAIDTAKYEVVPVGITKDGRWYLTDAQELEKLTAGSDMAEFTGGAQQVFLPLGAGDSRLHLVDWAPPLMLCSRSCTDLLVKTAQFRACLKWRTCPMWGAG